MAVAGFLRDVIALVILGQVLGAFISYVHIVNGTLGFRLSLLRRELRRAEEDHHRAQVQQ